MNFQFRSLSFCLFIILSQLVVVELSSDLYNGCKVYELSGHTQNDVAKIRMFVKANPQVDVWVEGKLYCRLMVSSDLADKLEKYCHEQNIYYKVVIKDVKLAIDQEVQTNGGPRASNLFYLLKPFEYNKFNDYRLILKELRRLNCQHKNLLDVVKLGKSYEGKPLVVVKITANVLNDCSSTKKIIWIDAGAHAREWITVAGAMYMIKEVVEKYTANDKRIRDLLNDYVLYIVPVFNPDGYQYTHTDDRLWRKTRSPNPNSECIGTDPNRNWDNMWSDERGSSSNPCKNTYHGAKAESEKCVKTFAKLLRHVKSRILVYWSLHSYGQLLLIPHSIPRDPRNPHPSFHSAISFYEAVNNKFGMNYGIGDSKELTGSHAFGTSFDYAYHELNIVYSYTIEMRPIVSTSGEDGEFGFLAPPGQIIPAASEAWCGILAAIDRISA